MRDFIPPKPTGADSEATFDQRTHDVAFGPERQLRTSKDISVHRSHNGYFLRLRGSGAQNQMGLRGPFRLQSVQGDYVTVRTWDPVGKVVGATDIFLAKEPKHRNSLTAESLASVTHTYTYTSTGALDANNIKRTDTYSATTEVQRLVPPWVTGSTTDNYGTYSGEVLYAKTAVTGILDASGNPIRLQVDRNANWMKAS